VLGEKSERCTGLETVRALKPIVSVETGDALHKKQEPKRTKAKVRPPYQEIGIKEGKNLLRGKKFFQVA